MSLSPEVEIYLTLPSHVCHAIYPGNTPANYKVSLNVPLKLHEDCGVALVDIQYQHSGPNILKVTEIYDWIKTPYQALNLTERTNWHKKRRQTRADPN